MADLQRCSPLLAKAPVFSTPGFHLREIAPVTKVRIQVLRSRGLYSSATHSPNLPMAPNTSHGTDPIALWRAPDDWLVYSETLAADALTRWVESISSDAPLVVTDVSSATAVFELSGNRAVDVLMRDCTLDLEGEAVPAHGCAQTQFAQTTVMIHRPTNGTWRLFVDRSVAQHVWDWLLDA